MEKKITIRELLENESFLRDYLHEAIKHSLPETRMCRYALNVFGIQNGLYSIIETDGEAWYDATLEQLKPKDLGEAVSFAFIIHGENKDKYIIYTIPKLKKYSLTEKVRWKISQIIDRLVEIPKDIYWNCREFFLFDLPRLFSRGDSDV